MMPFKSYPLVISQRHWSCSIYMIYLLELEFLKVVIVHSYVISYPSVIKHGVLENGPSISNFPIKTSIPRGFAVAVFDYPRVPVAVHQLQERFNQQRSTKPTGDVGSRGTSGHRSTRLKSWRNRFLGSETASKSMWQHIISKHLQTCSAIVTPGA